MSTAHYTIPIPSSALVFNDWATLIEEKLEI
jgi:hypothetical protein